MFLRRNRRRCHVTSVVRQKQKKTKKGGNATRKWKNSTGRA